MVVAFEDGMLVHASTLEHYLTWTKKMVQRPPPGHRNRADYTKEQAFTRFHRKLTFTQ